MVTRYLTEINNDTGECTITRVIENLPQHFELVTPEAVIKIVTDYYRVKDLQRKNSRGQLTLETKYSKARLIIGGILAIDLKLDNLTICTILGYSTKKTPASTVSVIKEKVLDIYDKYYEDYLTLKNQLGL